MMKFIQMRILAEKVTIMCNIKANICGKFNLACIWLLFMMMCVLFSGCAIQHNDTSSKAVKIQFPASESDKIDSFSVSFDLPEGWTVEAREPDAGQDVHEPLALASVTSIYDLYDAQGGLAGAVGYSPYEPYEGERDAPAVVYAAIRMGSVYRFDTDESYEVVKETDVGANAVMDVVLQEGGAGGSTTLNRGVLAYDRDRAVFVAFELDAGRVTAQQQREIAASVAFTA